MDQTIDYSKGDDNTEKSSGGKDYTNRRNTKKWYQRIRSDKGTRERRQSILERKWDCICEQKDLCAE